MFETESLTREISGHKVFFTFNRRTFPIWIVSDDSRCKIDGNFNGNSLNCTNSIQIAACCIVRLLNLNFHTTTAVLTFSWFHFLEIKVGKYCGILICCRADAHVTSYWLCCKNIFSLFSGRSLLFSPSDATWKIEYIVLIKIKVANCENNTHQVHHPLQHFSHSWKLIKMFCEKKAFIIAHKQNHKLSRRKPEM